MQGYSRLLIDWKNYKLLKCPYYLKHPDSVILIKIPMTFFHRNRTSNFKTFLYGNTKDRRIARTILREKNKDKGIICPNFLNQITKAIIIKSHIVLAFKTP